MLQSLLSKLPNKNFSTIVNEFSYSKEFLVTGKILERSSSVHYPRKIKFLHAAHERIAEELSIRLVDSCRDLLFRSEIKIVDIGCGSGEYGAQVFSP
jgi:hypothetical protein